jgi:hypothetical protein
MRDIRFTWWDRNHLLCNLFIGDSIHLHDLYVAEVQALVDALQFLDADPLYRLPEAIRQRPEAWYVHAHHCRPGHTLQAFMDVEDVDGIEANIRTVWDIHSGSCGVRITEEEAAQLIERWREFIGQPIEAKAEAKADWKGEGF